MIVGHPDMLSDNRIHERARRRPRNPWLRSHPEAPENTTDFGSALALKPAPKLRKSARSQTPAQADRFRPVRATGLPGFTEAGPH